jgi:hypothetical protein
MRSANIYRRRAATSAGTLSNAALAQPPEQPKLTIQDKAPES